MSDGPYKNLKLVGKAKKFADMVQNENVSMEDKCALASDALLSGIMKESGQLLLDLRLWSHEDQLSLSPIDVVRDIFESNSKSQFGDHLEREICFLVDQGMNNREAFANGTTKALKKTADELHLRIDEAGIEAYERGDMWRDQLVNLRESTSSTMRALDLESLGRALIDGDRSEIERSVKPHDNIDDGPML